MNAKTAEMAGTVVLNGANNLVGFQKQENIEVIHTEELTDIKMIDTYKKENKILGHLSQATKRFIDIIAGIVGLIILIPLTIGVYIANRICGDNGPVFYVQKRIGKNGKIFKMIKYRSMVVGAEEKLEKYLAENEEARKEYSTYKKLKHDPRITKVGAFLRKTSLDELPQLLNVLVGDMTLVGPRPYLPGEKEDMGEYYNIITKCKPGITGLWQTSGRSQTTFDDRLDIDIEYYKSTNLFNDIKLLVKTGLKVLKKEGAM